MTKVNITRVRGDTGSEEFTIYDGNGSPLNLVGSAVVFTVREYAESTSTILQRTSAAGQITLTSGGKATVSFAAQAMAALIPGSYVYDVQVTLADGTVHTPIGGAFIVLADVSR